MQAAAGLPASGSQSMPDSVAIRLQSVAGTRVAALLGRLTEQQAIKKGEAQLQELLSLCTVALSCKAALLGSAHGDEIRLDSSWRQNGAVSGKCTTVKQSASQVCSIQVLENSCFVHARKLTD